MSEGARTSRLAVLLATDLVGSAELKHRLGTETYLHLLERHDHMFRELIARFPDAQILQDTGDGYFCAFPTASDAVRFALSFQYSMQIETWQPEPLKTRVGINLGEITHLAPKANGPAKVVGIAADLAARVMSLACGGQILLTRSAFDEARQVIKIHPSTNGQAPLELRWIAHGEYVFKGNDEPIEVFEVGGQGIAPFSAPGNKEKARRRVSANEQQTLGWRPAVELPIPQRPLWVLERKLGEGTFGEVWLARHRTLREQRVFKFCFDNERLQSFKRELTVFRLMREALGDRRDISRLYDIRLDEPPFFLESEYASGGNLIDWAREKGGMQNVPLDARVEIVAQVCDAVAAAHSVGVIHKDIKPSNILIRVESDGKIQPLLSDFGIGQLTDKDQLVARNITEIGFTNITDLRSSGRSGTRIYEPPESLSGRPFTMSGDIYALGVLLYQVVIGDLERPMALGWEREVSDPILREDIAACVDGDPERRIKSAAEVGQRLRRRHERAMEAARKQESAASQVRRVRMLRFAVLLTAACLVVAAYSLVGYWRERMSHAAVVGSETVAKERAHVAQLQVLDNLILAGEGLTQSKRYGEAMIAYGEALEKASQLGVSPLRATCGILQAMSDGPPALINRKVTLLGDEQKFSPVVRARVGRSGKFVVAGDMNSHGYVIELPLGQKTETFSFPRAWVSGIAMTPDDKSAVIGTSVKQLQRWEIGSWKGPREIAQNPPSFTYALAMSPDGRTVVSGSPATGEHPGGELGFWSVEPLKRIRPPIATAAGILSAGFAPDGRSLATGDEHGVITIWDFASGTPAKTMDGHGDQVTGVAYAPDGQRLFSGSFDKTARIWDVASGKELHRLPVESGGALRDVAVSHDGKIGAAACSDGTVRCWNLLDGSEVVTFSRHPGGTMSVDFLPDDSAVVSGGINGRIAVWPMNSDAVPQWNLHRGRVAGLCVSADGLTAVSAGADAVVNQIDMATGKVLRSTTTTQPVNSMAVSKDGSAALLGESKGALEALQFKSFELNSVALSNLPTPLALKPTTSTSQPATIPTTYKRAIHSVAIGSSGTMGFAGGADQLFSVFGFPSAYDGFTRRAPREVTAGCFTPDNQQLLIAAVHTLFLVDTHSGAIVREVPTRTRRIPAIAISPDGKLAAIAGFDQTVRLLDMENLTERLVLYGHLGPVQSLTFFPDSKTLASASDDDTIRLWDVNDGKEVQVFRGHKINVSALAISPDGQTLLSGDVSGGIRKWDLTRPARHHKLDITTAILSDDLDAKSNDPAVLKGLGEWYAFRGKDDWAIQCLERARATNADISPLMLARCYWKLNRREDAIKALRAALSRGEAPAGYLHLCLAAIEKAAVTTTPSIMQR